MWSTTDDVEARLVVPPISRTMVSTVDKFGVGLKTLISAWSFRITALKEGLYPVLQHIREVLTWKKCAWTLGIVLYFSLRLVMGIIHKFFRHSPHLRVSSVAMVENIIRLTLDNAVSAIFVFMMSRFAVQFGWLRFVARISEHFWRKRFAPEGWAFAKFD
ncbi:unnamed protein product [Prorocentrum cordatum]|uniref:Uncharacterized protein n=1 Tax=Prorocentrum cordatum TaxID=2364126 RepID=A0ABN9WMP9_9DINO|nr:unnamed protein product [Polarella glacialis]